MFSFFRFSPFNLCVMSLCLIKSARHTSTTIESKKKFTSKYSLYAGSSPSYFLCFYLIMYLCMVMCVCVCFFYPHFCVCIHVHRLQFSSSFIQFVCRSAQLMLNLFLSFYFASHFNHSNIILCSFFSASYQLLPPPTNNDRNGRKNKCILNIVSYLFALSLSLNVNLCVFSQFSIQSYLNFRTSTEGDKR